MADALILCRFVQFAAALAVFGIAAFRLYALAGAERADPAAAITALDRWTRRAMTIGAIVALVSALALVPCVAASMAGSPAAAFDPAMAGAVLFDTGFGHAWCWHLVFAIVLVGLCLMPPRRGLRGATIALALLLLASLGWVGHAAMGHGAAGIGRELNQMLHLLAGGMWLGGLLPLGWLLRRARRADGAAFVALARTALPHFSQMGCAAVALAMVTGLVNGVLLVGTPAALVGTPYGRLLMLKVALFLAMVVLALVNRLRLMPRLGNMGAAASLGALARSVAVEQALGLGILAVVAVLGTWPPAIGGWPR